MYRMYTIWDPYQYCKVPEMKAAVPDKLRNLFGESVFGPDPTKTYCYVVIFRVPLGRTTKTVGFNATSMV